MSSKSPNSNRSLFGVAFEQFRLDEPTSSTSIPPRLAINPRQGSTSASYHEAAEAHQLTAQLCADHLEQHLPAEALPWLDVLIEAARQQGRTEAQAAFARLPTTGIKEHLEHKMLHVIKRLKEKFEIDITMDELRDLQPEWETYPGTFTDDQTLMRHVTCQGKTFFAVYELHPNGGKHLSTVVAQPRPPRAPAPRSMIRQHE